tara:strand:+ start:347 stop:745 length:399 start_codon:yes stop_codon:yes gene_type:complete
MELFLIYCPWVWIWAFFYVNGQTNKSPFISSFLGFIYTFITQLLFANYSFLLKLLLISIEGYVLFRVYFKHIYVNKKFTIKNIDLDYNIAFFFVFNVFLYINNSNLYNIYFSDLKSKNLTVKSWITTKLKPI